MRYHTILIFLAACLAPLELVAAGEAAAPDTRPNIIVILADDLGQGDIGPYGNTRIRTPHLDALAAGGVMLTRHYASGNVCTPSRAGLMTGRYPIRYGFAALSVGDQPGWGLPPAEYTLAELLRDRGYATFMIGKWGLGEIPGSSPIDHGFDRFYGVPNSNDMAGFALYEGATLVDATPDQASITELYTAAAESWIEAASADTPFFLYLAHNAPHIPLFPSAAFAGQSAAGTYGDVVEELDASLGRIVEALRKRGVLQNTVIVFTSDNGPFFEGDPGPSHGGKGTTWDGGYRVPFIANWPEGLPAGQVRDGISMNIDILPTLAELAGGGDTSLPLDGRSLVDLLGEGHEPVHDQLLFFQGEDVVAIREGQWKLVTHAWFRRSLVDFGKLDRLDGFKEPYTLLFDMANDPDERYSVADRHPEIVARLQQALAAARAEFRPLRAEAPQVTFPE